ncbi:MAG: hypothetical protein SF182_18990 [Deltaproteobacteria bacterium]|nr:hypothetical protein [Deltaproteobacteria bacterium]
MSPPAASSASIAEVHVEVPPPPGMRDPLEQLADGETRARRRYVLTDTGFDEVPKAFRKFYRRWGGESDVLEPNEVLCPVCKVVIRSSRELRVGDRVYCMPCMSRLVVVRGANGLEGRTVF